MITLRGYQKAAITGIRDSLISGKTKPVLCLPTGGGKAIIFGKMIQSIVENGKTVLWIVHRRNLVFQMRESLKKHFDVESGIIMAGVEADFNMRVQLCTIQSYGRRIKQYDEFFVDADVIMVDEGHHAVSKTYHNILGLYHDKIIVGCTATPMRADQKGLGEVFDDIVVGAGVKELTDAGYLSPVRYFVPGHINLDGVKKAMGDYQVKALANRVDSKKLVGDIVENWLRVAENRKTLVFCVNVAHSISVCDEFNAAGINAGHLDAQSSDDEREEMFDQLNRGDITVLTNVGLYQEGLDVPSISCVVMARPTKSLGLYRQCGGRGLRVEPGKDNLIFLDHGNVVETHGLLDWDIEWSLDGKERAWQKPTRKQTKKLVKCRACGLTFEGANVCPDCGSEVKAFGKNIETIDAELEELSPKKVNKDIDWVQKRLFAGALAWHAKEKGYAKGWAAHAYRDKFGVWPNDKRVKNIPPIEPEGAIKNMLTGLLIKKAKGYKKKKQAEFDKKDSLNTDRLIKKYQEMQAHA